MRRRWRDRPPVYGFSNYDIQSAIIFGLIAGFGSGVFLMGLVWYLLYA